MIPGDQKVCLVYGVRSSISWNGHNAGESIHSVGAKLPNGWGISDIIGNGHEWTCSAYAGSYNGAPGTLPAETCDMTSGYKSTRGGSYNMTEAESRSATRGYRSPYIIGGWASAIRLVRTAP